MQNTMRAVAVDRFGGLETLALRILPVPEVGPEQILVRVESAGVGKWDVFEREGMFAEMFGLEPKFPHSLAPRVRARSWPSGTEFAVFGKAIGYTG